MSYFVQSSAEFETAEEKLSFLSSAQIDKAGFSISSRMRRGTGADQTDNGGHVHPGGVEGDEEREDEGARRAIFRLHSFGIATNRDEWLYGHDTASVENKVKSFVSGLHQARKREWRKVHKNKRSVASYGETIKWTTELQRHTDATSQIHFDTKRSGQFNIDLLCELNASSPT